MVLHIGQVPMMHHLFHAIFYPQTSNVFHLYNTLCSNFTSLLVYKISNLYDCADTTVHLKSDITGTTQIPEKLCVQLLNYFTTPACLHLFTLDLLKGALKVI